MRASAIVGTWSSGAGWSLDTWLLKAEVRAFLTKPPPVDKFPEHRDVSMIVVKLEVKRMSVADSSGIVLSFEDFSLRCPT